MTETDRESDDEAFAAVFRSALPPSPTADFSRRVVQAVRLEPLPEGRRALSREAAAARWRWAAAAAAGAVWATAVLISWPVAAQAIARVIAVAVDFGVGSLTVLSASLNAWRIAAAVGRGLAAAMATAQASAMLAGAVVVAGLSLTLLQRILNSKEPIPW